MPKNIPNPLQTTTFSLKLNLRHHPKPLSAIFTSQQSPHKPFFRLPPSLLAFLTAIFVVGAIVAFSLTTPSQLANYALNNPLTASLTYSLLSQFVENPLPLIARLDEGVSDKPKITKSIKKQTTTPQPTTPTPNNAPEEDQDETPAQNPAKSPAANTSASKYSECNASNVGITVVYHTDKDRNIIKATCQPNERWKILSIEESSKTPLSPQTIPVYLQQDDSFMAHENELNTQITTTQIDDLISKCKQAISPVNCLADAERLADENGLSYSSQAVSQATTILRDNQDLTRLLSQCQNKSSPADCLADAERQANSTGHPLSPQVVQEASQIFQKISQDNRAIKTLISKCQNMSSPADCLADAEKQANYTGHPLSPQVIQEANHQILVSVNFQNALLTLDPNYLQNCRAQLTNSTNPDKTCSERLEKAQEAKEKLKDLSPELTNTLNLAQKTVDTGNKGYLKDLPNSKGYYSLLKDLSSQNSEVANFTKSLVQQQMSSNLQSALSSCNSIISPDLKNACLARFATSEQQKSYSYSTPSKSPPPTLQQSYLDKNLITDETKKSLDTSVNNLYQNSKASFYLGQLNSLVYSQDVSPSSQPDINTDTKNKILAKTQLAIDSLSDEKIKNALQTQLKTTQEYDKSIGLTQLLCDKKYGEKAQVIRTISADGSIQTACSSFNIDLLTKSTNTDDFSNTSYSCGSLLQPPCSNFACATGLSIDLVTGLCHIDRVASKLEAVNNYLATRITGDNGKNFDPETLNKETKLLAQANSLDSTQISANLGQTITHILNNRFDPQGKNNPCSGAFTYDIAAKQFKCIQESSLNQLYLNSQVNPTLNQKGELNQACKKGGFLWLSNTCKDSHLTCNSITNTCQLTSNSKQILAQNYSGSNSLHQKTSLTDFDTASLYFLDLLSPSTQDSGLSKIGCAKNDDTYLANGACWYCQNSAIKTNISLPIEACQTPYKEAFLAAIPGHQCAKTGGYCTSKKTSFPNDVVDLGALDCPTSLVCVQLAKDTSKLGPGSVCQPNNTNYRGYDQCATGLTCSEGFCQDQISLDSARADKVGNGQGLFRTLFSEGLGKTLLSLSGPRSTNRQAEYYHEIINNLNHSPALTVLNKNFAGTIYESLPESTRALVTVKVHNATTPNKTPMDYVYNAGIYTWGYVIDPIANTFFDLQLKNSFNTNAFLGYAEKQAEINDTEHQLNQARAQGLDVPWWSTGGLWAERINASSHAGFQFAKAAVILYAPLSGLTTKTFGAGSGVTTTVLAPQRLVVNMIEKSTLLTSTKLAEEKIMQSTGTLIGKLFRKGTSQEQLLTASLTEAMGKSGSTEVTNDVLKEAFSLAKAKSYGAKLGQLTDEQLYQHFTQAVIENNTGRITRDLTTGISDELLTNLNKYSTQGLKEQEILQKILSESTENDFATLQKLTTQTKATLAVIREADQAGLKLTEKQLSSYLAKQTEMHLKLGANGPLTGEKEFVTLFTKSENALSETQAQQLYRYYTNTFSPYVKTSGKLTEKSLVKRLEKAGYEGAKDLARQIAQSESNVIATKPSLVERIRLAINKPITPPSPSKTVLEAIETVGNSLKPTDLEIVSQHLQQELSLGKNIDDVLKFNTNTAQSTTEIVTKLTSESSDSIKAIRLVTPSNASTELTSSIKKINTLIDELEQVAGYRFNEQQVRLIASGDGIQAMQAGGGKTSVIARALAARDGRAIFLGQNETEALELINSLILKDEKSLAYFEKYNPNIYYLDAQKGWLKVPLEEGSSFVPAKATPATTEEISQALALAAKGNESVYIISNRSNFAWKQLGNDPNLLALTKGHFGSYTVVTDEISADILSQFSSSELPVIEIGKLKDPSMLGNHLKNGKDAIQRFQNVRQALTIDEFGSSTLQKIGDHALPSEPLKQAQAYLSIIEQSEGKFGSILARQQYKAELEELAALKKMLASGNTEEIIKAQSLLTEFLSKNESALTSDLIYRKSSMQAIFDQRIKVKGGDFGLTGDQIAIHNKGNLSGEQYSSITQQLALYTEGTEAIGPEYAASIDLSKVTITQHGSSMSTRDFYLQMKQNGHHIIGMDATPETAAHATGLSYTGNVEDIPVNKIKSLQTYQTNSQDLAKALNQQISSEQGKLHLVVNNDTSLSFEDVIQQVVDQQTIKPTKIYISQYSKNPTGKQIEEFVINQLDEGGNVIEKEVVDKAVWETRLQTSLASEESRQSTLAFVNGRSRALDITITPDSPGLSWHQIGPRPGFEGGATVQEELIQQIKRNRLLVEFQEKYLSDRGIDHSVIEEAQRFHLYLSQDYGISSTTEIKQVFANLHQEKLAQTRLQAALADLASSQERALHELEKMVYDPVTGSKLTSQEKNVILKFIKDNQGSAASFKSLYLSDVSPKALQGEEIYNTVYRRAQQAQARLQSLYTQLEHVNVNPDLLTGIRQSWGINQHLLTQEEFVKKLGENVNQLSFIADRSPVGVLETFAQNNSLQEGSYKIAQAAHISPAPPSLASPSHLASPTSTLPTSTTAVKQAITTTAKLHPTLEALITKTGFAKTTFGTTLLTNLARSRSPLALVPALTRTLNPFTSSPERLAITLHQAGLTATTSEITQFLSSLPPKLSSRATYTLARTIFTPPTTTKTLLVFFQGKITTLENIHADTPNSITIMKKDGTTVPLTNLDQLPIPSEITSITTPQGTINQSDLLTSPEMIITTLSHLSGENLATSIITLGVSSRPLTKLSTTPTTTTTQPKLSLITRFQNWLTNLSIFNPSSTSVEKINFPLYTSTEEKDGIIFGINRNLPHLNINDPNVKAFVNNQEVGTQGPTLQPGDKVLIIRPNKSPEEFIFIELQPVDPQHPDGKKHIIVDTLHSTFKPTEQPTLNLQTIQNSIKDIDLSNPVVGTDELFVPQNSLDLELFSKTYELLNSCISGTCSNGLKHNLEARAQRFFGLDKQLAGLTEPEKYVVVARSLAIKNLVPNKVLRGIEKELNRLLTQLNQTAKSLDPNFQNLTIEQVYPEFSGQNTAYFRAPGSSSAYGLAFYLDDIIMLPENLSQLSTLGQIQTAIHEAIHAYQYQINNVYHLVGSPSYNINIPLTYTEVFTEWLTLVTTSSFDKPEAHITAYSPGANRLENLIRKLEKLEKNKNVRNRFIETALKGDFGELNAYLWQNYQTNLFIELGNTTDYHFLNKIASSQPVTPTTPTQSKQLNWFANLFNRFRPQSTPTQPKPSLLSRFIGLFSPSTIKYNSPLSSLTEKQIANLKVRDILAVQTLSGSTYNFQVTSIVSHNNQLTISFQEKGTDTNISRGSGALYGQSGAIIIDPTSRDIFISLDNPLTFNSGARTSNIKKFQIIPPQSQIQSLPTSSLAISLSDGKTIQTHFLAGDTITIDWPDGTTSYHSQKDGNYTTTYKNKPNRHSNNFKQFSEKYFPTLAQISQDDYLITIINSSNTNLLGPEVISLQPPIETIPTEPATQPIIEPPVQTQTDQITPPTSKMEKTTRIKNAQLSIQIQVNEIFDTATDFLEPLNRTVTTATETLRDNLRNNYSFTSIPHNVKTASKLSPYLSSDLFESHLNSLTPQEQGQVINLLHNYADELSKHFLTLKEGLDITKSGNYLKLLKQNNINIDYLLSQNRLSLEQTQNDLTILEKTITKTQIININDKPIRIVTPTSLPIPSDFEHLVQEMFINSTNLLLKETEILLNNDFNIVILPDNMASDRPFALNNTVYLPFSNIFNNTYISSLAHEIGHLLLYSNPEANGKATRKSRVVSEGSAIFIAQEISPLEINSKNDNSLDTTLSSNQPTLLAYQRIINKKGVYLVPITSNGLIELLGGPLTSDYSYVFGSTLIKQLVTYSQIHGYKPTTIISKFHAISLKDQVWQTITSSDRSTITAAGIYLDQNGETAVIINSLMQTLNISLEEALNFIKTAFSPQILINNSKIQSNTPSQTTTPPAPSPALTTLDTTSLDVNTAIDAAMNNAEFAGNLSRTNAAKQAIYTYVSQTLSLENPLTPEEQLTIDSWIQAQDLVDKAKEQVKHNRAISTRIANIFSSIHTRFDALFDQIEHLNPQLQEQTKQVVTQLKDYSFPNLNSNIVNADTLIRYLKSDSFQSHFQSLSPRDQVAILSLLRDYSSTIRSLSQFTQPEAEEITTIVETLQSPTSPTPLITSRTRDLNESEKQLISKAAKDFSQPTTTQQLLSHPEFQPTEVLEINGETYFMFSKLIKSEKDNRDLALAFLNNNGKLLPRIFWKSNSEGGWRSTSGIFNGKIFKGNYHYTQESKPVQPILDYLNAKSQQQNFVNIAGDFILDYFNLPKLTKENVVSWNDEIIQYDDGGSLQDFQQFMPGTYSAVSVSASDFSNFNYPDNFIPDFSQLPISTQQSEHTLLGEITLETFGITWQDRPLRWVMAYDKKGRVWIDRIYFADSKITSYGVYNEVINSGALTNKPIEYQTQISKLANDMSMPIDKNYSDITPLLDKLPPIKQFKSSRWNSFGIPDQRGTIEPVTLEALNIVIKKNHDGKILEIVNQKAADNVHFPVDNTFVDQTLGSGILHGQYTLTSNGILTFSKNGTIIFQINGETTLAPLTKPTTPQSALTPTPSEQLDQAFLDNPLFIDSLAQTAATNPTFANNLSNTSSAYEAVYSPITTILGINIADLTAADKEAVKTWLIEHRFLDTAKTQVRQNRLANSGLGGFFSAINNYTQQTLDSLTDLLENLPTPHNSQISSRVQTTIQTLIAENINIPGLSDSPTTTTVFTKQLNDFINNLQSNDLTFEQLNTLFNAVGKLANDLTKDNSLFTRTEAKELKTIAKSLQSGSLQQVNIVKLSPTDPKIQQFLGKVAELRIQGVHISEGWIKENVQAAIKNPTKYSIFIAQNTAGTPLGILIVYIASSTSSTIPAILTIPQGDGIGSLLLQTATQKYEKITLEGIPHGKISEPQLQSFYQKNLFINPNPNSLHFIFKKSWVTKYSQGTNIDELANLIVNEMEDSQYNNINLQHIKSLINKYWQSSSNLPSSTSTLTPDPSLDQPWNDSTIRHPTPQNGYVTLYRGIWDTDKTKIPLQVGNGYRTPTQLADPQALENNFTSLRNTQSESELWKMLQQSTSKPGSLDQDPWLPLTTSLEEALDFAGPNGHVLTIRVPAQHVNRLVDYVQTAQAKHLPENDIMQAKDRQVALFGVLHPEWISEIRPSSAIEIIDSTKPKRSPLSVTFPDTTIGNLFTKELALVATGDSPLARLFQPYLEKQFTEIARILNLTTSDADKLDQINRLLNTLTIYNNLGHQLTSIREQFTGDPEQINFLALQVQKTLDEFVSLNHLDPNLIHNLPLDHQRKLVSSLLFGPNQGSFDSGKGAEFQTAFLQVLSQQSTSPLSNSLNDYIQNLQTKLANLEPATTSPLNPEINQISDTLEQVASNHLPQGCTNCLLFARTLRRLLTGARGSANFGHTDKMIEYLDQARSFVDSHVRNNLVIQETAEAELATIEAVLAQQNNEYGVIRGERSQLAKASEEINQAIAQIQKDKTRLRKDPNTSHETMQQFGALQQSLGKLQAKIKQAITQFDKQKLSSQDQRRLSAIDLNTLTPDFLQTFFTGPISISPRSTYAQLTGKGIVEGKTIEPRKDAWVVGNPNSPVALITRTHSTGIITIKLNRNLTINNRLDIQKALINALDSLKKQYPDGLSLSFNSSDLLEPTLSKSDFHHDFTTNRLVWNPDQFLRGEEARFIPALQTLINSNDTQQFVQTLLTKQAQQYGLDFPQHLQEIHDVYADQLATQLQQSEFSVTSEYAQQHIDLASTQLLNLISEEYPSWVNKINTALTTEARTQIEAHNYTNWKRVKELLDARSSSLPTPNPTLFSPSFTQTILPLLTSDNFIYHFFDQQVNFLLSNTQSISEENTSLGQLINDIWERIQSRDNIKAWIESTATTTQKSLDPSVALSLIPRSSVPRRLSDHPEYTGELENALEQAVSIRSGQSWHFTTPESSPQTQNSSSFVVRIMNFLSNVTPQQISRTLIFTAVSSLTTLVIFLSQLGVLPTHTPPYQPATQPPAAYVETTVQPEWFNPKTYIDLGAYTLPTVKPPVISNNIDLTTRSIPIKPATPKSVATPPVAEAPSQTTTQPAPASQQTKSPSEFSNDVLTNKSPTFQTYTSKNATDNTIEFSINKTPSYLSTNIGKLVKPTEIIVHWDGNNNSDQSRWVTDTTYNGILGNNSSSTFAVGIDGVLQMAKMTEDTVQSTWAATSHYSAINIEMAGKNFDKNKPPQTEYQYTIDLITKLLVQYNLSIDDIKGHYETDTFVWTGNNFVSYDPTIHSPSQLIESGKIDPGPLFLKELKGKIAIKLIKIGRNDLFGTNTITSLTHNKSTTIHSTTPIGGFTPLAITPLTQLAKPVISGVVQTLSPLLGPIGALMANIPSLPQTIHSWINYLQTIINANQIP